MARGLTYDPVPIDQLTTAQLERWRALLPRDGDLASPFFCPEYAQVVGHVRDSVDVVVIRDRHDTVGFFPFERRERFVGRPVGGAMSNFQGVIAAPGTAWSAAHIAREAGLTSLLFHHQTHDQVQFAPFVDRRRSSPIVDLSGGWDAYLGERARAGVNRLQELPKRMRKLEKDLGALSFVAHTTAPEVLDQLVAWKRDQYIRTGARGSLSQDWCVDVIRRLSHVQGPGLSGAVSALFAGPKLIAAHAGIRSATALHYWFPAYDPDPEVSRHSPGLVLMFEICRWATGAGIRRIDCGPGEGPQKDIFATTETTVVGGQIVVPPYVNLWQRVRRRLFSTAP